MIFEITIGDWSGDGHSRTKSFIYETETTVEQLRKAYKHGAEKAGVDMFEECSEYEERELSDFAWKYFEGILEDEYLMPSDFALCVITLIRQGNPDLEITEVKPKTFSGYWNEDKKFNGQLGYGLFG